MQIVAPDPTRAVLNQPPPLADYDLYAHDTPLREAVEREGGCWIADEAHALGARCGSAEVLKLGMLANEHPPALRAHDRYSHRLDVVEYHPAYDDLMQNVLADLCLESEAATALALRLARGFDEDADGSRRSSPASPRPSASTG